MTLFLGILAAAVLGGCAVADQDATDVGQQLTDGLQGRGRLVHDRPTDDSFGSDYN